MGRYEFFHDFFNTDIMNHVEAVKKMMKLDSDDDRLLVPALFQLARGRGEIRRIHPFYAHHKDRFKNIIRMIVARSRMQDLRGHKFNIYECASLELDPELLATAVFTFSMQIFLLYCLVYHSVVDNGIFLTSWWLRTDKTIIVIAALMTLFFAKLSWKQWGDAFTFHRIFNNMGVASRKKQLFRYMNIVVNAYLAVLLTVFNFFFISVSSDSVEAILNGLAVYFIIELDDLLAPDWDDARLDDAIAINIQDYFMENGREDIYVEIISAPDDDQCQQILLDGDDKVYIQLEHFNGFLAVTLHWRRSPVEYQQFRFKITGNDRDRMLGKIKKFRCIQNFLDIHGTYEERVIYAAK